MFAFLEVYQMINGPFPINPNPLPPPSSLTTKKKHFCCFLNPRDKGMLQVCLLFLQNFPKG